jgi:subtilisin family serine protease
VGYHKKKSCPRLCQIKSAYYFTAPKKFATMKKLVAAACCLLLLTACQKSVDGLTDDQEPQTTLSRQSIDAAILSSLSSTGRFNWSQASTGIVWSALEQSDHIVSVGYKPAALPTDLSNSIHQIDLAAPEWQQARQTLLTQVLTLEQATNPALTAADLVAYDEAHLPVLDLVVRNPASLTLLRNSNLVRYAEPMGYEPQGILAPAKNPAKKSSSGCGSNNAEAGLSEPADFVTVAPGSKQSWNYAYHNIPAAWAKASGSGRRIMIIDTGLSPDQPLLGSSFNNGLSSGRTVERRVTLRKNGFLGFGYGDVESSTSDGCGHGTSMAGAATAPRNNLGGAVGVAYNSGLLAVRAGVDVLIDESRETKGVADAFVLAGNTANVNIVSMSMGRLTSSGQISDAVNYAYNKGKLIFCAAGTSVDVTAGWYGVIFPAYLTNVNAVTGIKDNGTRCDACHQGSEVDFVVVMEKSSNGRKPLTTAQSGLAPATVGGSSVSTATTAAIAALVWSRFPSLTREQVLTKMVQSSNYFPTRNGNFGWGKVNADAATN